MSVHHLQRRPLRRRILLAIGLTVLLMAGGGCRCSREPPSTGAATSAAAPAAAAPASSGLRLVVVVVIDQLPSWSFERDRPYLHGGLARLLDGGLYVKKAEFPYANTFTAPGHAALATGAPPAVTGIMANAWYSSESGDEASCIGDPSALIHGLPIDQEGASPHELRVDGLADALHRATSGRSRSVSVSLKDRAAILMLGRKPDLAVWYEPGIPAMTTSSFYTPEIPRWLRTFNDEHDPRRYVDRVWTPLDDELLRTITGIDDDAPGEGGGFGFGPTFPHALADAHDPARAVRMTPAGTELLLSAAEAAVLGEGLGQDDAVDLLGISISNHDYAGHYWGQGSWERTDLLLRIDRQMSGLLDFLDRRVGRDRYAVAVISDHGGTPMPERYRERGVSAYRVSGPALVQVADAAADRVLGPGNWAVDCSAATIYLTAAFRARSAADRARALDAMQRAIAAVPGVGFVAPTSDLRGHCDQRTGVAALACRALGDGSGDLFVAAAPGSSLTSGYPTGGTHGSPNDDDRFVPFILHVPGHVSSKMDYMSVLQFAPTIARLLGVPAPPAAKAPPLQSPYLDAGAMAGN